MCAGVFARVGVGVQPARRPLLAHSILNQEIVAAPAIESIRSLPADQEVVAGL
jgi:hypothetical protein